MEETEVKKYRKEYYQKHKEENKNLDNYNKKYYQDNKQKIKKLQLKYRKTYYEKNKNDIIKYGIKYYETNGAYKRKSYSYNNKLTANRFAKQQKEIEKRRAVYFKTEEINAI